MYQTTGTFFDGISSVPQPIEVKIDEHQAELIFVSQSFKVIRWAIEEIQFEEFGNSLEIKLITNNLESIKVNDPDFIRNFLEYMNKNGHIGWYYKVLHLGIRAYITMAIVILGLIIGGYLLVIPWVAEKAVLIIPEKYDASLGLSYYKQYLSENDIDSVKSVALNNFAGQLKLNNTRTLHFTVIKSNEVNAFALPDGNILVFTGLLDLMKNYDELAGLIGHEVTHVNNRHSMKILCRNLSGYIFISAVLSDVNGIMTVIADNAHNLQSLSYSRQFEQEADEQGTELMIQNHINPQGMTTLFTRLKKTDKINVPAFISSHPLTNDRIVYIQNLIKHKSFQNSKNEKLEQLFKQIKL